MSTTLHQPAQSPAIRTQSIEERQRAARERAKQSGVKVYRLGPGRFAVTSSSDPTRAYEVTVAPSTCSCPAGAFGDAVCIHRAAVSLHLNPDPEPEPPTHLPYDADEEALRWAKGDRDRAYRSMEKFTKRLERGDVLTDGEFFAFECAQEREIDASTRIAELTAKLAKKAQVAA